MKKALSLASVALIAAASLTACGGGSSSSADYCDIYSSAHEEFGGLDLSDATSGKFDKMQDYIDQLKDAAPNDKLKDAWETSESTLTSVADGLKELGIDDPSKLKDIHSLSDLPEGVSEEDFKAFAQKMQKIDSSGKMEKAQDTIEDYAKNTCDIDM